MFNATDGDTVYITDIECEILSVFVKRKILTDAKIIGSLEALITKLEISNGTVAPF